MYVCWALFAGTPHVAGGQDITFANYTHAVIKIRRPKVVPVQREL